jgi:hypothetical protein
MVNLIKIIERAKKFGSYSSEKEFANKIGLSAPDFSKRKKSGTLLPLIIDWGIAEKVNLNWLLTGGEEADQREPESPSDRSSTPIENNFPELINQFKDRCYAKDLNARLVELERLNSEAFKKVGVYTRGLLDGILSVSSKCQKYDDPDRRYTERRVKSSPKKYKGTKDRRSGKDRRVAVQG